MLSLPSQNDTLITLSANARDVFGHVTLERTAGNRCHFVTYDGTYGDFPASETSRVGAVGADGCGTTWLTTTAVFDRVLGVATEITDPHGQRTYVAYDATTKPRTVTFSDGARLAVAPGTFGVFRRPVAP